VPDSARSRPVLALALLAAAAAQPAGAHFLEILPDADVLPEGGPVALDIVFTHPFDGGPVMELARPAEVGVLAAGTRAALTDRLAEAPCDGVAAWRLDHALAEPGAAVFYVAPQPYWEPAEGKFIIHYAKVVVDAFASGEGWDAMAGLPVEIRPLTRPTGVWAGNLFSGVVTKDGAPVPFAEIEVEFVNDAGIEAPNDAFITQVITADASGTFIYAMPFPGWWGFAALVEADAPMTSPEGAAVPVELGGLIWVRAVAPER
jgi:cobalt/nickel transport protein